MPQLELTTSIAAPATTCFDLSLDVDLHVDSMARSGERAVAGITAGAMALADEVTWRARHFGLWWTMTSRIAVLDRPRRFVDEMVRGPFASFRHEHLFVENGATTTMRDIVDFRSPLGPLGALVDRWLLEGYMRRLLEQRNRHIRRLAERPDPSAPAGGAGSEPVSGLGGVSGTDDQVDGRPQRAGEGVEDDGCHHRRGEAGEQERDDAGAGVVGQEDDAGDDAGDEQQAFGDPQVDHVGTEKEPLLPLEEVAATGAPLPHAEPPLEQTPGTAHGAVPDQSAPDHADG